MSSDKSDYLNHLNQLHAAASSAIDSVLSITPMFDLKPTNTTLYSNNETYPHIFGFERLFDSKEYVDSLMNWMNTNWTLSIKYSLVYIILVFAGKSYMQNRPRYELRLPLIIWNIILAVFSIIGTIRVWPDFVYTIRKHGIVHSVCDNSYAYGITGFWSFMFVMSKLPELVDTLFIVLRKQELIFLHWYHHATVLVYCWFSYKDFSASGRWFMTMNYFVHGMMYSYYAFKAMRFKVPRFVSQLITTGQLLQMVAGCYVNYIAWDVKNNKHLKCANSDDNIKYSSLMYLSYFILFGNFFIQAYVFKKKFNKPTVQQGAAKDENNNNVSRKIKKIN